MLEVSKYQVGSQGTAGAKWRLLETQASLLIFGTGFPGGVAAVPGFWHRG